MGTCQCVRPKKKEQNEENKRTKTKDQVSHEDILYFEKKIAQYDTKNIKLSDQIVLISKKLKLNPNAFQKNRLLTQITQKRFLLKRSQQSRQFLLKSQMQIYEMNESAQTMKIIQNSNKLNGDTQQKLNSILIQCEVLRANKESNNNIREIIRNAMQNPEYQQGLRQAKIQFS